MSRSYRHIKQYEEEILELRKQGLTQREIGERFGLSREQIKEFFKRERRKERKIEAGHAIHKKGRPCQKEGGIPPSIQELDNCSSLKKLLSPTV